jgi:hypothetical protein
LQKEILKQAAGTKEPSYPTKPRPFEVPGEFEAEEWPGAQNQVDPVTAANKAVANLRIDVRSVLKNLQRWMRLRDQQSPLLQHFETAANLTAQLHHLGLAWDPAAAAELTAMLESFMQAVS